MVRKNLGRRSMEGDGKIGDAKKDNKRNDMVMLGETHTSKLDSYWLHSQTNVCVTHNTTEQVPSNACVFVGWSWRISPRFDSLRVLARVIFEFDLHTTS